MFKVGLGEDSHRLEALPPSNPPGNNHLRLGGTSIYEDFKLVGNSDADVILHALTNAISSITGVNILGAKADEMLEDGTYDSMFYLEEALKHLSPADTITHVSISVEAKVPHLADHIRSIKKRIATLMGLEPNQVGLTATTGEGLTAFGRGEGIRVSAIVSCVTQPSA